MFLSALVALIASASVGCGAARIVHRTPAGGVVALEGDRNKAMEQAHQLMADHCGGPYQIMSEGEHVVGTDRAQSTESYVTEEGEVVEERGESTREATEWRLRYSCGNAPAGDQQAAPEGEQGPPPAEGEEGAPPDEPPPPGDDPEAPPPDEGPPGEPSSGQ
jgi:hypothetical protein